MWTIYKAFVQGDLSIGWSDPLILTCFTVFLASYQIWHLLKQFRNTVPNLFEMKSK